MPDISMCANGKDCPRREECYRFTAVPTPHRQWYANWYEPGKECDAFMQIWKKDRPRAWGERKTDAE